MAEGWVGTNERRHLGDGSVIEARVVDGPTIDRVIDDVAEHEAYHVLAAFMVGLQVYKATNEPSADYLGATWTDGYNAAMVAAPKAFGCGGTSGDEAAIREEGDSVSSAMMAARALLKGRESQVRAIATAIQRAGTVSGGTMQRANAKAKEGARVEFVMTGVDGHVTRTTRMGVKEEVLQIPVEL